MSMKKIFTCVVLSLFFCLISCTDGKMHIRSVNSFNNDWKFYLGDMDNGAQESLDDTNWRTLNLPHDWAVEGDFSPKNPSGTGGGALPGGVGWYRKTFVADESYQGKKVYYEVHGDHGQPLVILYEFPDIYKWYAFRKTSIRIYFVSL